MTAISLQRIAREWLALLAILAMVLGPLSLAVSRGLSAQERVNVAAGLASLPLCSVSDMQDGTAGKNTIDCDHCLPASGGLNPEPLRHSVALVFAGVLLPARGGPSTFLRERHLPPATGPPILM